MVQCSVVRLGNGNARYCSVMLGQGSVVFSDVMVKWSRVMRCFVRVMHSTVVYGCGDVSQRCVPFGQCGVKSSSVTVR